MREVSIREAVNQIYARGGGRVQERLEKLHQELAAEVASIDKEQDHAGWFASYCELQFLEGFIETPAALMRDCDTINAKNQRLAAQEKRAYKQQCQGL